MPVVASRRGKTVAVPDASTQATELSRCQGNFITGVSFQNIYGPATHKPSESRGAEVVQVWRTEFTRAEERDGVLRPGLGALPPRYARAAAYHVGVHPTLPPLSLLRGLRAALDRRPAPGAPPSSRPLSLGPSSDSESTAASAPQFVGSAKHCLPPSLRTAPRLSEPKRNLALTAPDAECDDEHSEHAPDDSYKLSHPSWKVAHCAYFERSSWIH